MSKYTHTGSNMTLLLISGKELLGRGPTPLLQWQRTSLTELQLSALYQGPLHMPEQSTGYSF